MSLLCSALSATALWVLMKGWVLTTDQALHFIAWTTVIGAAFVWLMRRSLLRSGFNRLLTLLSLGTALAVALHRVAAHQMGLSVAAMLMGDTCLLLRLFPTAASLSSSCGSRQQ